jgi:hypothetical protein
MDETAFTRAYASKRVWTNVIAIVAYFIQWKYGVIIPIEVQAAVVSLLNLWLVTISPGPVKWGAKRD